jgi:hypothetical protein
LDVPLNNYRGMKFETDEMHGITVFRGFDKDGKRVVFAANKEQIEKRADSYFDKGESQYPKIENKDFKKK